MSDEYNARPLGVYGPMDFPSSVHSIRGPRWWQVWRRLRLWWYWRKWKAADSDISGGRYSYISPKALRDMQLQDALLPPAP